MGSRPLPRLAFLLPLGVLGGCLLLTVPEGEATVGEQRARLPPPAECPDPITGVWKSHQYNPREGLWTEFTLHVRRVSGSDRHLEGEIYNHSWQGGPEDAQPGPCGGMLLRDVVFMKARGIVRSEGDGGDDFIEFWGVGQWRIDQVLCRQFTYDYNLDHFSGRLDHELHEFQSVNNDGGIAVNEPTLFRRIRCSTRGKQDEQVEPPPYYPPRSGCGLW